MALALIIFNMILSERLMYSSLKNTQQQAKTGVIGTYSGVLLIVALLAGCGNIANVRSFSTPYVPPTTGETAKIRVISNGMLRAVPNSTCIDWRLPGAGVMVVPQKGFANLNNQDLGMQQSAASKILLARAGVVSSELYVAAGKPIVLHFMGTGSTRISGSGASMTTIRNACNKGVSFVPEAGKEYDASFVENGSICSIQMGEVGAKNQKSSIDVPQLAEAGLCNVMDNL
jgi:hypothetical protein